MPSLLNIPRLKNLLLLLSVIFNFYLLCHHHSFDTPLLPTPTLTLFTPPTTRQHLLFAIASSSNSWTRRKPYVRFWYSPNSTRAFAFLDRPDPSPPDPSLPLVVVSGDTSRFPYSFPRGLRSAIRVARVVKEIVERNESNVRWFVFGDDDTVFFVDNLVKTLAKYDHDRWFYVGSSSESFEQNVRYSFDMAFGGGGFAISHSLGKVLAKVFDSCLMRYPHLYGSDSRVFSCVTELGVGLTHEPGFHQVDMRRSLFGMLSSHPLSPLVSLHHLDAVDPIFPNMNATRALEHLFKAANVDSTRILQQTICYDRPSSLTISVAWGYAIQVFEGNQLLPNLLALQRTFTRWRRSERIDTSHFMFNMREYPRDPCNRPAVFFLRSVISEGNNVWSNYDRHVVRNCWKDNAIKNVEHIRVFSPKLDLDIEQMKAPRRQCCDILRSFNRSMIINLRKCGVHEMISMHT